MNKLAGLLLAALTVAACGSRTPEPAADQYETATAERRPLVLVVEAAGVIEPIRTVELKSKASGEILQLGADTGDTVAAGAMLVLIDPRIPRNRLDQALAQQNAAKAKLTNARSQLARGEKLRENAWINPADYDKLVLDAATAESEVVAARVAVENARIALEDTEVGAPVDGTILSKRVERGQVISSPTTDVGGGTLLMSMANLDRVRVRTRVDETDIGKLVPGMEAQISVASFPGKRFAGTIEKVEPQATVEQNVTLFPVLITLPNEEHLLRPGMNVEARFEVARRDDPLTIPVTALRTERDAATTAGILGVTEEALRAKLAEAGMEAGPTPGERRSARESAAGLRGSFWVVADRKGVREPVPVVTGVTDLDRVEITSGLAEGDVVLVLPSSSLLETQERLQNFMRGRGGIPGITQQPQQSGEAQGAPRGSPGAASGQRPAGGQRPANGQRPPGTQRPAGSQP
jgi:HlyD family secretion protein